MIWKSLPERAKPWLDLLQGVGTVLALTGGAYWFYLQRNTEPQIKLDQIVTQRPLAGADDRTLITVEVRATNVGKVKVSLQPGSMEIRQLNPTGQQAPLKVLPLGQLTLEPGEADQSLFKTFVLYNNVKTIQVHSQYRVPKDMEMYWNLYSPVDLGTEATVKNAVSTAAP